MRLITEVYDNLSFRTETLEEGVSAKKSYFVEGIYAQANQPNRNKRIYSREVMETALEPFQVMIAEKRALGELGHPQGPVINLDRVSHLITKLEWSGNDVVGKSKILDTPNGKIVQNFIDEGIKIGMSTRAMGSVKLIEGLNHVQKDMKLATIDIVADPSAHNAFVEGLMEGKEWIFVNGVWSEQTAEQTRQDIVEAAAPNLTEAKVKAFSTFLKHMNRIV